MVKDGIYFINVSVGMVKNSYSLWHLAQASTFWLCGRPLYHDTVGSHIGLSAKRTERFVVVDNASRFPAAYALKSLMLTEHRWILGFSSYFRDHIRHFATIAKPLIVCQGCNVGLMGIFHDTVYCLYILLIQAMCSLAWVICLSVIMVTI